jgi:hypothetical protein
MCNNLGNLDWYVNEHVAQLRQEREQDRLADLASQPGRPIRRRIADWLVSTADWVEGRPRGSTARAEA